jgi:trimeric autotransporter adhesin
VNTARVGSEPAAETRRARAAAGRRDRSDRGDGRCASLAVRARWRATACALVGLLVAGGASAETFIVSLKNDSGEGTLRWAIEQANASPGPHTIAFGIGGDGPHTIELLTALPAIRQTVAIEGYTQFGATPNTLADGFDAVIKVILRRAVPADPSKKPVLFDGLQIQAPLCAVRGLAIGGFGRAIYVDQGFAVIEGNVLGLLPDGTVVRNETGISVGNGSPITVGGTAPGSRNVISENFTGIRISGNASDVEILGNLIGTDLSGHAAAHHRSSSAIWVDSSASEVRIGNGDPAAANVIAFDYSGVAVQGSKVSVRNNSIHSHAALGIDLVPNLSSSSSTPRFGVTRNDGPYDQDNGPNSLQNFPTLTSAKPDPGGTTFTVKGVLESYASQTFIIDFYGNDRPNNFLHGEGKYWLGAIEVTTKENGTSDEFSVSLPIRGVWISSTATRKVGNGETSEFSTVVAIERKSYSVAIIEEFNAAIEEAKTDEGPGISIIVVKRDAVLPMDSFRDLISSIYILPAPPPDGKSTAAASATRPVLQPGGFALGIAGDGTVIEGLRFEGATSRALQIAGNDNLVHDVEFVDNKEAIYNGGERNAIAASRFTGAGGATAVKTPAVTIDHGDGNLVVGNHFHDNAGAALQLFSATNAVVADNVFETSGGPGVWVLRHPLSWPAVGNRISRNTCAGNLGLCIDLSAGFTPDGVTANDAGDVDTGVNAFQNYPVLASAAATVPAAAAGEAASKATLKAIERTDVSGTLPSRPDAFYTLEFFAAANCHDSGHGEADVFLGDPVLGGTVVVTDGNGDASFTFSLPRSAPVGSVLTATATDVDGNTSEMSACIAVSELVVLGDEIFADGFEPAVVAAAVEGGER